MARTLEELVLRLDADSRSLRRELNLVDRKGKETSKSLRQSFDKSKTGLLALRKAAAPVGVALAAVAGTAGLGAAAKGSLDFADAIGKTASKLGVSTDALQEWRFAADQSGVQMNTLDMAAQRFTRRAGEAALGTGEAKDAIAELGLELRDSEGRLKSTETLFSQAMAALSQVDQPAERLRLAFKLFDSEGAALVNLADNFAELTEQARRMGVVIDAETIAQASKAKGEFDALSMVTKQNLTTSLISLAPVLLATAEGIATISTEVAALVANFRDVESLGTRGLESRLQSVDKHLESTRRRIQKFRGAFFGMDVGPAPGEREPIEITGLRKEENKLLEERAQIVERLEKLNKPLRSGDASGAAGAGQKILSTEEERAAKAAEKEAERRRKGAEAIALEVTQLQRLVAAKRISAEEFRSVEVAIATENEARRLGIDLLSDEGAALEDNIIRREKLTAEFKRLDDANKKTFDGLIESSEQFSDAVGSAFADMVLSGEASFQQLGESFARDFIARATSALILSPIFDALGSGGGILGGIFGVGQKAAGGPVNRSTPYIVGEKGPELFVPATSGTIVPNNVLNRSRGTTAIPSALPAHGGGMAAVAPVIVNVTNTNSQASVSAREGQGAGGMRQIEIMVGELTDKNLASGRHDGSLTGRFGIRPRGRSGL